MNTTPTTITGNLVRDPEFNVFGTSTKASFSLACEHRYMKDGEWVSDTSFFPVVAWRFPADDLQKSGVGKGAQLMVSGRLDQRSWEDKEGNKRSIVEVVADNIAIGVRSADRIGGGAPAMAGAGASVETDEAPWS